MRFEVRTFRRVYSAGRRANPEGAGSMRSQAGIAFGRNPEDPDRLWDYAFGVYTGNAEQPKARPDAFEELSVRDRKV